MNIKRGYTIVETLVVVALVAVVGVVAGGYYMDYVEDARRSAIMSNEQVIRDAIARHFKSTMKYPSSLEELQGGYLHQSPVEMLLRAGGGHTTIQVEVAKSLPGTNLYHTAASDRTWIEYEPGSHDGREIANIRAFVGAAPAASLPGPDPDPDPDPGLYLLVLSGGYINSSPAPGLISAGVSVTVTVFPPAYHTVETFTVNGVDRKTELIGNQYSLIMAEATNVNVTYSLDPVVTTWNPGGPYTGGSVVEHGGALFEAPWYIGAGISPPSPPWRELTDEWRVANVYNTGDLVWHNGVQFVARQWTQGDEPGIVGNPWNEITDQWRTYNQYNTADQAWYDGQLYEAKWWVNPGEATPDLNAAWELK